MREWNAETYHRVSNPQFDWGMVVLARLPLDGGECVLDVGCDPGRLTEQLLARLPFGRVIGIDQSTNMVSAAREHLKRHGDRLQLLVADAAALPIREEADAVFSTATFHWVLDHPRLFRSLHDALKPGGRLVAQCGGAGNLARIHLRTDVLIGDAQFAPYFAKWSEPWEFAGAELTAQRLAHAGFEDIRTSIEQSPVAFPDAETFRAFITNVICRPHLAYLPDTATKVAFIDRLTQLAANDAPPFELDYWRLNLSARRPRPRVLGPN